MKKLENYVLQKIWFYKYYGITTNDIIITSHCACAGDDRFVEILAQDQQQQGGDVPRRGGRDTGHH